MASVGWVTPGAATEGVTPLFFSWKTWRPFIFVLVFSGVTRVGDTRGGNWGCHPLFFPEKPGDLFFFISLVCGVIHGFFSLLLKTCRPFLLIAVTIVFYCFHSGVTPSRVSPHTFFTCPTRFSTNLCKFAHKNYFPSGVTPWRVSPGAICPPSDATACSYSFSSSSSLSSSSSSYSSSSSSSSFIYYRPRMLRRNVLVLSVSVSVCNSLTFESFDVECSLLVCRYLENI